MDTQLPSDAARTTTAFEVRRLSEDDIAALGVLLHAAFIEVARRRSQAADFRDPDAASRVASTRLAYPGVFALGALAGDELIGAVLAEPRGPWVCVGPVAVHPDYQGRGVARRLLELALRFSAGRCVYLLHDAFNADSLGLYLRMGFALRSSAVLVEGRLRGVLRSHDVRALEAADVAACSELARVAFGYDRKWELARAVERGTGRVLDTDGIEAYATDLESWQAGHAVAVSEAKLQMLLAGSAGERVTAMVPSASDSTLTWTLRSGLRAVKVMNVMSIGRWSCPWLPSLWSVHG